MAILSVGPVAPNTTKNERKKITSSQQSGDLLADMSTAAAYMSTKKTAEAEKQVNSKHASWESADFHHMQWQS